MRLEDAIGRLAVLAVALSFVACKNEGGKEHQPADTSARDELTAVMVKEYATTAFPLWARDHVDKQCPDSIQDLARYTGKEDPKDPWGNELVMVCGENAPEGVPNRFGVISKGEDGKLDTQDDIKSWERKNR